LIVGHGAFPFVGAADKESEQTAFPGSSIPTPSASTASNGAACRRART
jgi:hypothetical protein